MDVGWKGSQQVALQAVLSSAGGGPDFAGLYLATIESAADHVNAGHVMHGYLVDADLPVDRVANLQAGGFDLLETFCSAPHGTVIGYQRAEGRHMPILSEMAVDRPRFETIRPVQEAVLQFVEDYLRLKGVLPGLAIDPEDAYRCFGALVHGPSLEEARRVGGLIQAAGYGATGDEQPLAFLPMSDNKEEITTALDRSLWKPGFLRLLGAERPDVLPEGLSILRSRSQVGARSLSVDNSLDAAQCSFPDIVLENSASRGLDASLPALGADPFGALPAVVVEIAMELPATPGGDRSCRRAGIDYILPGEKRRRVEATYLRSSEQTEEWVAVVGLHPLETRAFSYVIWCQDGTGRGFLDDNGGKRHVHAFEGVPVIRVEPEHTSLRCGADG